MDPPSYSPHGPSPSRSFPLPPPLFLNIAPLSDQSSCYEGPFSFQNGYLGAGSSSASVKGEVQIKVVESAGSSEDEGSEQLAGFAGIDRVEVWFRGSENAQGAEGAAGRLSDQAEDGAVSIELFQHHRLLWDRSFAISSTTSNGTSSDTNVMVPPSSMPFDFELTEDLPHCIHLSRSGIDYRLIARVTFSDTALPPLQKEVPIHLIRADHDPDPTSSSSGFLAQRIRVPMPTPISITISRHQYRRSEPITILTRIVPPNVSVVQEKGLRLRSISAELLRIINVKHRSPRIPGLVPPTDSSSRDGETGHGRIASAKSPMTQNDDVQPPSGSDGDFVSTHRSVLSHSGKSCRFSPSRAVVIRLFLHPTSVSPLQTSSCESITQSTILHDVTFYVRVVVSLLGPDGDRQDVEVQRQVEILPDRPESMVRAAKQMEAEIESTGTRFDDDIAGSEGFSGPVAWERPAPTYHETIMAAGPSTLGDGGITVVPVDDEDDDEEFDGYEDILSVSAAAAMQAPPPAIDDDEPPPALPEDDDLYMEAPPLPSSADSGVAEPGVPAMGDHGFRDHADALPSSPNDTFTLSSVQSLLSSRSSSNPVPVAHAYSALIDLRTTGGSSTASLSDTLSLHSSGPAAIPPPITPSTGMAAATPGDEVGPPPAYAGASGPPPGPPPYEFQAPPNETAR